MNTWKTVLLCTLLLTGAVPTFAQAPDKAPQMVFRFVEGKDMFYVPWGGNGTMLDSICRIIDLPALRKGSVKVDGYSRTKQLSMIRCNRVKSELITRKGMTEEHFTTTNNTGSFNGMKNVVIVTLPLSAGKDLVTEPEEKKAVSEEKITEPEEKKAEPEVKKTEEQKNNQREEPLVVTEKPERKVTEKSYEENIPTLSLRANLLRWASLTPDLGIEWRISPAWSIQLNGTWTSWSWDNKDRRYALWEISPEIRYYIGKEKRGYLGAMYQLGEFNYKLNDTGKQGDLMGGGLTGGYLLKLNRALSLDFSLGIGCTHADYNRYTVIDGTRVKQAKEDKNYWGVNHAGITLVWTIY